MEDENRGRTFTTQTQQSTDRTDSLVDQIMTMMMRSSFNYRWYSCVVVFSMWCWWSGALCLVLVVGVHSWSWPTNIPLTRRHCLQTVPTVLTTSFGMTLLPPLEEALATTDTSSTVVVAATTNNANSQLLLPQAQPHLSPAPFRSAASPKTEYTNSIVASRDTNISPLEVYDTIKSRLQLQQQQQQQQQQSSSGGSGGTTRPPLPLRALDVGAGAGVSTQVIYDELGITTIDAVDWSGDAWQINVVEQGYCPQSVQFYAMDDERFVETIWKAQGLPKYDIIAFNFAINRDKALYFCQELLQPGTGLLLAPINTQTDYWLKQTYQVWNAQGQVTWSANDVGAWSVQFQPDVTADTCQGIWCAPYNGFQKIKR